MKIRKLKSILILVILLIATENNAQNLKFQKSSDNSLIKAQVSELNLSKLLLEDFENEKSGLPLREALLYPLEINIKNSGRWTQLDDSHNNWRLTIDASGSYGIIIRYKDLYIPKGAKLYVYTTENNKNATLYTYEDNPTGGFYSTETWGGESITLEYVAPIDLKEQPRIETAEIGYCYKDIARENNVGLRVLSDANKSCMLNVNCPEAMNWQDQKKGVVRIRVKIKDGLYLSSGSLVNNTNKDKTPYVLSACHCFYIKGDTAEMKTAEFYFNDEFPSCENHSARPKEKLLIGAELLVLGLIDGGSDVALVKLTSDIPKDYDIFFNGWNRENKDKTFRNGAVIHHPYGDAKKISFYTDLLATTSYKDSWYTSAKDAHWMVRYVNGSSTAGGSSGSPIFNQDGLIVGTLTGGESKCSSPGLPDYFGKFSYHWDQNAGENQQISKYLDPTNSGVTQLPGMYRNGVTVIFPSESSIRAGFIDGGEILVTNIRNRNIDRIFVTDMNNRVLYSKKGIKAPTYIIPNTIIYPSGVYILSVDYEDTKTVSLKIMK